MRGGIDKSSEVGWFCCESLPHGWEPLFSLPDGVTISHNYSRHRELNYYRSQMLAEATSDSAQPTYFFAHVKIRRLLERLWECGPGFVNYFFLWYFFIGWVCI